jgi:hypothetical protein
METIWKHRGGAGVGFGGHDQYRHSPLKNFPLYSTMSTCSGNCSLQGMRITPTNVQLNIGPKVDDYQSKEWITA